MHAHLKLVIINQMKIRPRKMANPPDTGASVKPFSMYCLANLHDMFVIPNASWFPGGSGNLKVSPSTMVWVCICWATTVWS